LGWTSVDREVRYSMSITSVVTTSDGGGLSRTCYEIATGAF
jgi:hypothetical protein